jgi:DNA polymerase I-like protein with 3'-5' exonuclease and polymerase domains
LPKAEVKALERLVREEMRGALELDVPVKVNIATGENWLDAK